MGYYCISAEICQEIYGIMLMQYDIMQYEMQHANTKNASLARFLYTDVIKKSVKYELFKWS